MEMSAVKVSGRLPEQVKRLENTTLLHFIPRANTTIQFPRPRSTTTHCPWELKLREASQWDENSPGTIFPWSKRYEELLRVSTCKVHGLSRVNRLKSKEGTCTAKCASTVVEKPPDHFTPIARTLSSRENAAQ